MMRSGNTVSSHTGLITDWFGRFRERRISLAYGRLLSLPLLFIIFVGGPHLQISRQFKNRLIIFNIN